MEWKWFNVLDRIQVISRLLDIASFDYSKDKVRDKSISIEDEIATDVVQNVIRLIEEMTLPPFWELTVEHLPNPPQDAFSPRKFNTFEEQKKWHYHQEFFHEILSCVDFIADSETKIHEKELKKNECIESLINWQESLIRFGKVFRRETFKLL